MLAPTKIERTTIIVEHFLVWFETKPYPAYAIRDPLGWSCTFSNGQGQGIGQGQTSEEAVRAAVQALSDSLDRTNRAKPTRSKLSLDDLDL